MEGSKTSSGSWSGYVPALLATIIWSGNFIVARGLSEQVEPVTLAFYRWSTATLALLPFGLRGLVRQRREVAAHLRHLVPVAFLGVTIFNSLLYLAAKSTTALNLSLIAVTTPIFILGLALIFLREAVSFRQWSGVVLAAAGIVVLATEGDLSRLAGLELKPGDLWMLLASLDFAVYTILVRRKPPLLAPVTYLMATFSLGVLMLLPWAAWEWSAHPPSWPTLSVLGSILYIGVGASLLSYLFWNRAVSTIGPARAGAIYYSLPVFCGLEAWLILGEPVTWANMVSGFLVISGIAAASKQ